MNVPPNFAAACFDKSVNVAGEIDGLRRAEKSQLYGEGGEHESMCWFALQFTRELPGDIMAVRGGGVSRPMPSYEGPELDVRVGMPLIQHGPIRQGRSDYCCCFLEPPGLWRHISGRWRSIVTMGLHTVDEEKMDSPIFITTAYIDPPSGYSCRDAKYAPRGVARCVWSVMWTKREAYWICWWCGRCSWLARSRTENMCVGPSKRRLRMRQATDEEPINSA